MGFTSDACWFLLLKTLLIKNNKKREAALKNEAGGDEKRVFFLTWPNTKSADSNQFEKALEMKCMWDTRRIKYHKFTVTVIVSLAPRWFQ